MRWLLAAFIVLLCSVDVAAQTKLKEWRVTYLDIYSGKHVRSAPDYTMTACIAAIKMMHPKDQAIYICTTEKRYSDSANNEAADATPK